MFISALLFSAVSCSTLLCCALRYPIAIYSALLYSTLVCSSSILLCSTQLYSPLLCTAVLSSPPSVLLLYSTLLLLSSTLLCPSSPLLCSALLCSALLYSALLCSVPPLFYSTVLHSYSALLLVPRNNRSDLQMTQTQCMESNQEKDPDENHMQTDNVNEKCLQSLINKYGLRWPRSWTGILQAVDKINERTHKKQWSKTNYLQSVIKNTNWSHHNLEQTQYILYKTLFKKCIPNIPKRHPKVTQNGSFLGPGSHSEPMVPPESLIVHQVDALRHPEETHLEPYGDPESHQILKIR